MCCKKIKDILHPFNIFGKDKRNFVIDIPNEDGLFYLNIEWTGDRLQVVWTKSYRNGGIIEHRSERKTYENGTITEETIEIRQSTIPYVKVSNHKIYLDCTNVTYLSVNGEDLI